MAEMLIVGSSKYARRGKHCEKEKMRGMAGQIVAEEGLNRQAATRAISINVMYCQQNSFILPRLSLHDHSIYG